VARDEHLGFPQGATATTPASDLPHGHPARPGAGPGGEWYPDAPGRQRGGLSGQRAVILVLCAVVGAGVGVGAQRWVGRSGSGNVPVVAAKTSAAPVPVTASVSSFDPKGSGFPNRTGTSWRSQTYATAQFGKLKPGIGLLLDLGSARSLRAVTFDARTGPLTVELRAADSKASSIDGYQQVGGPVTANGSTSLPASAGGSHRYWMVWVTSLASSNGGFLAEIASVAAQG